MRCFRQGCDQEKRGMGSILEVGTIELLDRFTGCKEKRNEIRLLGFWLENWVDGLEVRKTRDVQVWIGGIERFWTC